MNFKPSSLGGWTLFLALALGLSLISPSPGQAQEPPDLPGAAEFAGDYVESLPKNPEQSPSLTFSQVRADDDDGDGLLNTQETTLGTDPNNIDSDCDFV